MIPMGIVGAIWALFAIIFVLYGVFAKNTNYVIVGGAIMLILTYAVAMYTWG